MMTYKYFTEEEFKTATPSCSLSDMNPLFMLLLDEARTYSSVPFVINSAYRTISWEKERGRKGTSSHTKGLAVDIACTDSHSRNIIVTSLLRAGFNRIGVASTFIHVDYDTTKPQNVIFLYD